MAAALLSFVITPQEAIMHVHGLLGGLLPQGGARGEFDRLLDVRLSQTLATMAASSVLPFTIGLLSVIWASMQVYVAAATSMNMAFGVKENRSWLRLRVTALGLLISNCILLSASLLLAGVTQTIDKHPIILVKAGAVMFAAIYIASELVAMLLNVIMFVLIYKILPASRNSWRSAVVGGVVASVLFEVAKSGLAAFLLRPNHSVYGGFADIIVFVLWVYYSTTILILGCEAAAVYARHAEPGV
jgi:membrane protein